MSHYFSIDLLYLERIDMGFNWHGSQLTWNSIDKDFNWHGFQLTWISIDMAFNLHGFQLTWFQLTWISIDLFNLERIDMGDNWCVYLYLKPEKTTLYITLYILILISCYSLPIPFRIRVRCLIWIKIHLNIFIWEATKKVPPLMSMPSPPPPLELNGHRNFFSLQVIFFLIALLLPTTPLNGLAISGGTFFAASLCDCPKPKPQSYWDKIPHFFFIKAMSLFCSTLVR